MSTDELADLWRSFGANECRGYSPLYERITDAVAASRPVLEFLLTLPAHALQPNLLLAGVHDRVLRGEEPDLAACFERGDTVTVGSVFVDAVLRSREALRPVLTTRRTQTNEIGRVALLAPALASIDAQQSLTLVDVGTSAGLTLSLEHCRIDFGEHGALGPVDSPVHVVCAVLHGSPPIASTPIARRIGLDANPLDPTDPDDFRWLLACTWPDTGRTERTRAALTLAAQHPAELRTGEAVDDLPDLLAEVAGPVVVTTTWVAAYLTPAQRHAFGRALAAASVDRPVWWVSAEAPGVVEALPRIGPPDVDGASASVLGLIQYARGAETSARVLAHTHPHGLWIWWYE